MTTFQNHSPVGFAVDAERVGGLSSELVPELLPERLDSRSRDKWPAVMNRMPASSDGQDDSPEAMLEEFRLVRAERRAGVR